MVVPTPQTSGCLYPPLENVCPELTYSAERTLRVLREVFTKEPRLRDSMAYAVTVGELDGLLLRRYGAFLGEMDLELGVQGAQTWFVRKGVPRSAVAYPLLSDVAHPPVHLSHARVKHMSAFECALLSLTRQGGPSFVSTRTSDVVWRRFIHTVATLLALGTQNQGLVLG